MRAPGTLRAWLEERSFSLAMSSGFFGFFAHAGVLSVLEEEGLLPRRISGSSAGALVGGAWAAGLGARDLAKELLSLRRSDFWDPAPGAGLLAGRLFRRRLDALLPVDAFEQCRVPLAISVFDVLARGTKVLRSGPLAVAIHASCAVPGLFHPVWLDGWPHWDGGVLDCPGLSGMPEGEPVLYHHLASRSPWRRPNSVALQIPKRAGLVALVIDTLPRAGPFRLDAGARAYEEAKRATRVALDAPLGKDAQVRVPLTRFSG